LFSPPREDSLASWLQSPSHFRRPDPAKPESLFFDVRQDGSGFPLALDLFDLDAKNNDLRQHPFDKFTGTVERPRLAGRSVCDEVAFLRASLE
jgi:hypothetical protein